MPPLKITEYTGEITWLGMAPGPGEQDTLRSTPCDSLDLTFAGLTGARHQGETRPACVRVSHFHDKGTEIRNARQLTVLSAEEMDLIAADMGLEALDPGLAGVNIVIRGIPDFTHVPPSSRLQGPSGATLTVDTENLPCVFPAKEIEAERPGHGKGFVSAAKGRRGVTAWVERPGPLRLGDRLTLIVPAQRAWAP